MLLRYKDHSEYSSGFPPDRFFNASRALTNNAYYSNELKNTTVRMYVDTIFTARETTEQVFFCASENGIVRQSPSTFANNNLTDIPGVTSTFQTCSVTPVIFILTVSPDNVFRLYSSGELLGQTVFDYPLDTYFRYQIEIKFEQNGVFRFWIGNQLKLEVFSNFQSNCGIFSINYANSSSRSISSFAIWDDRDDEVDFFKGFLPDFKINLLNVTSVGSEQNGKVVITQGAFAEEYNPSDYGPASKLDPFDHFLQQNYDTTTHPYFNEMYIANRYSRPGTDLYKFQTLVENNVFGTGKKILGVLYRNHTLQAGLGKAVVNYVIKDGAQKFELKEDDKIQFYSQYHYEYYAEFSPFPSFAKNPITGNDWTESDIFNYEFGIKYSLKQDLAPGAYVEQTQIAIAETLPERVSRVPSAHTFAAISDFNQSVHTRYDLYSNIGLNESAISQLLKNPCISNFDARVNTFFPILIGRRADVCVDYQNILYIENEGTSSNSSQLDFIRSDVALEESSQSLLSINTTMFYDIGESRVQLYSTGNVVEENSSRIMNTHKMPFIDDNGSRIMNTHKMPFIDDNGSRIMNTHKMPFINDNGSRIMNAHSYTYFMEDATRLNGASVFYVTTEVL